MFDQIPVRIWLLILIAIFAYQPANYLFRHIAASPSRRDITQPSEDISWRTSADLIRSLSILVALAALAIFIFTPTAEHFAQSPTFLPVLVGCMGLWALYTVPHALITGEIEPFVRGIQETYNRALQPKRFWASVIWNAALGSLCVGFAYPMYRMIRDQPAEDRCYYHDKAISNQDRIGACNALIGRIGRSDDKRAATLAGRGSAYFRMGNYRRALADNSKAIQLDPEASYIRFNRALIYDVIGDLPRALADYGEAIRLDPDHADAYLNRGLILLDNGRFDAAIADFSKARELDPKSVWALANRGMAYAWKNDRPRAEADFKAARRIDPTNAVIFRGEGLLAMNANNMRLAVKLLSASLEADPDNRMALAMRAEAYGNLAEYEKARADRARMQTLRPRWLPISP